MIQRKQTVFLFLALLTTIACLCLPVGSFEPKGMGAESMLMNLWISDANGGKDFNVWALFAILLVTCPINLVAFILLWLARHSILADEALVRAADRIR